MNAIRPSNPTLRLLSLGAGVQSTVLALMTAADELPRVDGAIFADTGWEPARVYAHLDRLAEVLAAADIPLHRVSAGNLRDDALNPTARYASVPYFVLNPARTVREPVRYEPCDHRQHDVDDDPDEWPCAPDDQIAVEWRERPATRAEREGMGRRQCTDVYKLAPINRKVRELLGAAPPDYRRVTGGQVAEQWIGFSADEIGRVPAAGGVRYVCLRYPLVEMGMDRRACERWLTARGWTVEKSACIGCPYHGNRQWRELRDQHPAEWQDAVQFDAAIRKGGARGLPLNGEAFLHRSRVPLSIAPIDRVTRREWADRQGDLFDELGDPDGCSPYGCRSGAPAEVAA